MQGPDLGLIQAPEADADARPNPLQKPVHSGVAVLPRLLLQARSALSALFDIYILAANI